MQNRRDLTQAQYDVLAQLHHAQQMLTYWKAEEQRLRMVCVTGLATPEKEEGTETIHLANGWTAKIVKSLNYKLDSEQASVRQMMLPDEIAKELISWKPSLSAPVYRKLSEEHRAVIEPALIIKPGMPTFELIPPTTDKVL